MVNLKYIVELFLHSLECFLKLWAYSHIYIAVRRIWGAGSSKFIILENGLQESDQWVEYPGEWRPELWGKLEGNVKSNSFTRKHFDHNSWLPESLVISASS
jgi:hypothetical protein